jgi:hypothetical protein
MPLEPYEASQRVHGITGYRGQRLGGYGIGDQGGRRRSLGLPCQDGELAYRLYRVRVEINETQAKPCWQHPRHRRRDGEQAAGLGSPARDALFTGELHYDPVIGGQGSGAGSPRLHGSALQGQKQSAGAEILDPAGVQIAARQG